MHKLCDYYYVIICIDNSYNYEIISHNLYRSSNMLKRFVLQIEEELLAIQTYLSVSAEMIMTLEDFKALLTTQVFVHSLDYVTRNAAVLSSSIIKSHLVIS